MTQIRSFFVSSRHHIGSASLGALLAVPSSLFGIMPQIPQYAIHCAIFFSGIAVATLYWVSRQPLLSEKQSGQALSWFTGAVTATLCCLWGMHQPVSATPIAVLATDPNAPPCVKVVSLGFKCSQDSLQEAIAAPNIEAIALIVAGGQRFKRAFSPFNDAAFPDGPKEGWAAYAKAVELADGPTKVVQNCTGATTVYGCAILSKEKVLACAVNDTKINDPMFNESIAIRKKEAADEEASRFNKIRDFVCKSNDWRTLPEGLPTKYEPDEVATIARCSSIRRSGEFEAYMACEKERTEGRCPMAKAGFLKDVPNEATARQNALEKFDREYDDLLVCPAS